MTKECDSPKEQQPQGAVLRWNLDKLKFELSSINEGIQSYILGRRINGTWGPSRYLIGGEENGSDSESYGDKYSMVNYTDEDDDAKPLFQCPICDFEIDCASLRAHYDPRNMICPVCDEKLGEDAARVAQNSSKRSWKSDKSSASSGDSVVFDKKLPASGRHETVPDPLLSPFLRKVSVPNFSGIQPGEGSTSNASDIFNGKGSGTDPGDEEDIEERRRKACFVRELVLSTLI